MIQIISILLWLKAQIGIAERIYDMKNIEEMIKIMHIYFEIMSKNIKEVLDNCSDTELYVLNAESYAIYCTIFAEVKIRVASHTLQFAHQEMYGNNPWTRIEH
jgi:hypothetical protein